MIEQKLKDSIAKAFNKYFNVQIDTGDIALEATSDDYEGDYTFVVFPYLKISKKNPEQTANEIGIFIKDYVNEIKSFNVIKGFLNISLSDGFWIDFLKSHYNDTQFGCISKSTGHKILIEYSSPNTNKPLHLGHVRNNLLGYSISQILKANGHHVVMCNLVNDRGIHICKSMLAWMKFGNEETPESSGIKGDHLVGKYYVEFDKKLKKEIEILKASGKNEEEAEKEAPMMIEAQEMLRKWESGDTETLRIWKMMNGWVYSGFDVTYKNLGVTFDKYYYESDTYILGKEIVAEGLARNVFFKKADGSVWVDLTDDGLDQKLLLRSDGTSVYITQDIGTAELKYHDFYCERSLYVVGNEQDYHFKVLKLICSKLSKPYAEGIFHLSYGMVELPSGKMKSREGTVVDADDLIDEMISTAEVTTKALGKTEGLGEPELKRLYEILGLGALKYYLLKVEPKKKMLFNPEESIDFHGNTGPFVQYTYARIKSVLRNGSDTVSQLNSFNISESTELHPLEKRIIELLQSYPQVVTLAGRELSPGIIANFVFELAKAFNHFYHELSILKEELELKRKVRLMLCMFTANCIKTSCRLLGMEVPERM